MTIHDLHRLYYAAAIQSVNDVSAMIWMLAADSVILRMRAAVYHHNPEREGEDGVTAEACTSAAYTLMRLVTAMCSEHLRKSRGATASTLETTAS